MPSQLEYRYKLKNKKVLNWKLRTFSYINFGFLNRLENELK